MTENKEFRIIYDENIELTEEEIEMLSNEYEIDQKDGEENA